MHQNAVSFRKTRIAPTPTGYLHLGNVYSFALTAALAQKHNAKILLRIDDLDHQRVNNAYVQDIFDTLEFLGIPWHEGPRNVNELEQEYSQLRRLHLYRQALQQMQDTASVFACDCSRTTVLQNNAAGIYPGTCLHRQLPFSNNAWRLNTSAALTLAVKTLESKTIQEPLPPEMQYFVVKKKDGFPAYQLASLVDDVYFDVDFVVRGADLWPSTIAQQYLANKLQQPAFGNIIFHHHPLLSSPDGGKLSKSAGSTSVQFLRKQGKTAADIYAMVGNLAGIGDIKGWEDITGRLLF